MRNATGGFAGYARSPMRTASALFCCVLTFTGLAGCPTDGGNGNGNSPDSLTGSIVSLISDIVLSGNQTLSIVYNADTNATSVEAFFVEVESTAADAPTVGAEVVFATDLSTGDGQVTSLQTGAIPTGLYRVGLNLAAGSLSAKVFSQGTFRISSLPVPEFSLPNQNITRIAGTNPVQIQATLGSPENAVNWRVFFIPANMSIDGIPAGQLGTTIDTGRASEAIVSWTTAGVPNGDFMVGISVTDSGQSVAQTSSDGNEDRILTVLNPFIITFADEEPPPRPPLVRVTKPSGPETLFAGETTLVEFSATFFEGPPEFFEINVFYDFDGMADTGDEVVFSPNLPPEAVSAVFLIDLIEVDETVRIGVTADDGKNAPSTVYAPGSVTFGTPAAATLTCTQPSSLLNVKPNEGIINVNWQTTGISSAANGNFDVFIRRTDANNMPTGPEIPVLTDAPLTQFSTMFMPAEVGKFEVSVRVTLDADPSNPLEDACPSLVSVSSSPSVLWLGDLNVQGDEDPAFDGAVFEGVNFEDNAGSAFAGGEDFNNDGMDEFMIVSRYGKPQFVNPTGIGDGEAYLIQGTEQRLIGPISLNSVSGPDLPGVVFTGLSASPANETDGIATVFFSGDFDADGVGEVVFGFPRTASQRQGVLGGQLGFCPFNPDSDPSTGAAIPQFFRGGVVAVSSRNPYLQTASNISRVSLDPIGQVFTGIVGNDVGPEPDQGGICNAWLGDLWEFDRDQDCPPDAIDTFVGCVPGTDGDLDTVVQPEFGFDTRLADPFVCFGLGKFAGCPIGNCPACDPNGGCVCDQFDPAFVITMCQTRLLVGGDGADCGAEKDVAEAEIPLRQFAIFDPNGDLTGGTGFYPERLFGARDADDVVWNVISTSLIGARIVGLQVNDGTGTSITQSGGNLIISAPFSTTLAAADGGTGTLDSLTGLWQIPQGGALEPQFARSTPRPHQYMVGGLRLLGDESELIQNVVGIPDFNRDGRDDIAIGAPLADIDQNGTPDGALYIAYRRQPSLEGNFFLVDLKRNVNDPERLAGLLVREELNEAQRFGESVAGDFDFNDDGRADVVVGNPDGNNGTGEIVIIFGSSNTTSNENGLAIEGANGLLARRQGARITGITECLAGEQVGAEFGFNVANIGDIDGDGLNDLAIAAPNATPTYDSNPTDNNDSLDPAVNAAVQCGIDRDLDGMRDNVNGPFGFAECVNSSGFEVDCDDAAAGPIPIINVNDQMRHAGLVYIILSSTDALDFADNANAPMDISIGELGGGKLDGFILVGRRGDRFAENDDTGMFGIEFAGDFLGGGLAGRTTETIPAGVTIEYGGNANKAPVPFVTPAGTSTQLRIRDRSQGLGRAGDVDGDGLGDFLIGAQLADPRVDNVTGEGQTNGGEAYLIYGFTP